MTGDPVQPLTPEEAMEALDRAFTDPVVSPLTWQTFLRPAIQRSFAALTPAPLEVWAVVYSNYDPPEVGDLFTTREAAEADADRRNADGDSCMWTTARWRVSGPQPPAPLAGTRQDGPAFDPWRDLNTDAMQWAEAFCALYGGVSVDTMLGWFANAIEVGRSAAIAPVQRAPRRVLEGDGSWHMEPPDNDGHGFLGDGVTGRTGDPDDAERAPRPEALRVAVEALDAISRMCGWPGPWPKNRRAIRDRADDALRAALGKEPTP